MGDAGRTSRRGARTPLGVLGAVCLAAALSALAPSCLERRSGDTDAEDDGCASCHGDPTREAESLRRAAPPSDLLGASDPAYPGVGAHAIHLAGSATHGPIACSECHVVPERTEDPGHADDERPAEIVFGRLAVQDAPDAAYDPVTRRCSDGYCHGDAGAIWTAPRVSEEACGTCHGLPPPAPHPQSERCSGCHGDVIDDDRRFVNPALHVDGNVQVGAGACARCHGSEANAAPPADTRGNDAVTAIGVGAHQAHLAGGSSSRALACEECHRVPERIDEPTHADGLPAEVVLTGIATTDDRAPAWKPETTTCADSWCHGPSAGSDSASWVTPGPLDCTSCHGAPPPPPHPQSDRCAACHGDVVDDNRQIIARDLHVDGVLQLGEAGCVACHGGGTDPAPPADVSGGTARTEVGVGAHQIHLGGGVSSRPVECDECHVVPGAVNAPTHADGLPAELVFGGVAISGLRTPSWDRSAGTCGNTWCHSPGAAMTPSAAWTSVGPLGCTACHGSPPPAPHPQMDDCSRCHGEVVGADDVTITDSARHVDGIVDVVIDENCVSCHGSTDAAPPPDVSGATVPSASGVGAHRTHVDGTPRARAVPCVECHVVPQSTLDLGHMDTARPAEVVFSGAALAHDAAPSYSQGSCQDTPCHGAVFPGGHTSGGANTVPAWTTVDGSQAACGTCHALPPPPPHPYGDLNPVCSACHENIAPDNATFTRPDLHVDGVVTFTVP